MTVLNGISTRILAVVVLLSLVAAVVGVVGVDRMRVLGQQVGRLDTALRREALGERAKLPGVMAEWTQLIDPQDDAVMARANARIAEYIAFRIAASSAQVQGIAHSISRIAGQTNMPSLNARSRRRAGEGGRGFAVVADGVGKLAESFAAWPPTSGTASQDGAAASARRWTPARRRCPGSRRRSAPTPPAGRRRCSPNAAATPWTTRPRDGTVRSG